jgi:hypothetical protein
MKRRKYYDVRIFPSRFLPQLLGAWPLKTKHFIRDIPGARQLKRVLLRRNKGPADA